MADAPAQAPPRVGMSLGDFLAESGSRGDFELIEGEKRFRMPTVYGHAWIANLLALWLNLFAVPKRLGQAFVELTFVLPDADDPRWVLGSRIPDVCFYLQDRLSRYHRDNPDHLQRPLALVPDLVVEVVSANDSFGALIDKVGLYLRDGVRLVWVIDPQARRVVVYTPDSTMRVLTESDTLTGGAVLPEFSAPLSELLGAPEPPTA